MLLFPRGFATPKKQRKKRVPEMSSTKTDRTGHEDPYSIYAQVA